MSTKYPMVSYIKSNQNEMTIEGLKMKQMIRK